MRPLRRALRANLWLGFFLLGRWLIAADCGPLPAAGVVLNTKNATIAGGPLLPGHTILPGDEIAVDDGAAKVSLGDGSLLTAGPGSRVQFSRQGEDAVARVGGGDVTLVHSDSACPVEVRAAEMSIRPAAGRRTRALIRVSGQSLTVAAGQGAVRVLGRGYALDVTEGNAIHLSPEDGEPAPRQNPQAPDPPQAAPAAGATPGSTFGPRSPGRVALCSLGGAGLGSIPVLVTQAGTSPDPGWRWSLIPVGAITGGLLCHEFPRPSSGACSIEADDSEIVEGDPVTLTWSSPPGSTAYLTDVGPEPASGQTTVTPKGPGVHRYELKAKGPAGTMLCMAEVKVVRKAAATCELKAEPEKLDKPGDETKLTWTLPPGTTEARMTTPAPARDLLTEKQPLSMKLARRTQFLVFGKSPAGEFSCRTVVDVTEVKCKLSAAVKPDGRTVTISWTSENATSATLEPLVGTTPAGESYEVPQGEVASGSTEVTPERSLRYVLTVKGPPRPDSTCEISLPVPSCDLWARRIDSGRNRGKYQLNWQYSGNVNKLELDPEPKPKTNLRAAGSGGGSMIVDPADAGSYTMTVTGGWRGQMKNTCSVDLKATLCSLSAPPEVPKNSKTIPIQWTAGNAASATLETIVNGKPSGKPRAVDVSAGEGTIDEPTPARSTEYVMTVKGPGGATSQCRACVTPRSGTGKTLPIQPETQKTGMWCWLTVGEMIFRYYGVPNLNPAGIYQCGIIGILMPNLCGMDCRACAALGGGQGMRQFLTDMMAKYPQAAKKPPIQSQYVIRKDLNTCPLDAKQVKAEIDEGRPVIAGISTSGAHRYPPEHVALIVGYEEVDGKLRLRVNDPYPFPANNDPYTKAGAEKNCGGSYYLDYDTFCNKLAWDSAWYGIKPASK